MKNKLFLILRGPLFLISSIILGIIVLPLGFLYSLGWLLYKAQFKTFFIKLGKFILEILYVISYICEKVAVGIDILGNVIAGELFEDMVTSRENTLYGQHGITLSASTGELELKKNLNSRGIFFTNILSKVFEKNHSILAYKYYKLNQKIIEDTRYLKDNEDYSWDS